MYLYIKLAGATRPCPCHYIEIIKCTVRAKQTRYALQTLFRAPAPWFRVKARSRRSRPDQGDYWKEYYTFCLIKFAWHWFTMAPEAHGAQVLPDPDYGLKNMICPHQNRPSLQLLFYNFFPSLTVTAVDALQTLFRPPWPQGSTPGPKHSLWPGPCKVRPPYEIWWGLIQQCVFLYRTHTKKTQIHLYI
jgi:hypothetical protein